MIGARISRARLPFPLPAGAGLLLASALYVLAGGSGGAGGVEEAEAQVEVDRRPNVVVIQTDDQRLDTMGAMPKTRRLIGRQGTTFRNNFATHPRCCPSRASYLTGQYSHNHRVQANRAPHGGFNRLDHTRTLPVWVEDAGYVTGHIGKYMNGYKRRSVPARLSALANLSDGRRLTLERRLPERCG